MALLNLIRLPKVEAATGYKRSTIYRLITEKKFPAPISLSPCGGRASAWVEEEVENWIKERISASRHGKHNAAEGQGLTGSGR